MFNLLQPLSSGFSSKNPNPKKKLILIGAGKTGEKIARKSGQLLEINILL